MQSKDCPMNEMSNLNIIISKRNDFISKLPIKYKSPYFKALESSNTSSKIKAKCLECVGYTDCIDSITDCRGYSCSLYFARPFSFDDTDDIRKLVLDSETVRFPAREMSEQNLQNRLNNLNNIRAKGCKS